MHILISGFVKIADSEGRFGKQITELLSRFRTTGHDHLRRYGCSIGIKSLELHALFFAGFPNGTLRRRIIYPGL